jgi:hypothetical protein
MAMAYANGQLGIDTCFTEMVKGIDGKCYNPQGPMPAILMAPLIVLFGPNVGDYLFTVLLSSLAGGVFMLAMFQLRRKVDNFTMRDAWTYSILFSDLVGSHGSRGKIVLSSCL